MQSAWTVKSTIRARVTHLFGQGNIVKKVFLSLKKFLTSDGIGHDLFVITKNIANQEVWFLSGQKKIVEGYISHNVFDVR